jgi:hypothetical protein
LSSTAQVGLFVTSPFDVQVGQGLGLRPGQRAGPGISRLAGRRRRWASNTDWDRYHRAAGFTESGGRFTVIGSGDIAPQSGAGTEIQRALIGGFAGLITVIVVALLFVTSEYRRPLIRTTLAASPRRGQVLLAKAVVIGSAALVAGLIAAGLAVPIGSLVLRRNGAQIPPLTVSMGAQVIVGTAGILAVASVLAIGTLLRRGLRRSTNRSTTPTRRPVATSTAPRWRASPSCAATRESLSPSPSTNCAGETHETSSRSAAGWISRSECGDRVDRAA